MSFNPRPREGGDSSQLLSANVADIGFNPRPREGGDAYYGIELMSLATCFNPRPREGGDSTLQIVLRLPIRVSIHAPVKGATPTA